ncbi:MAG: NADH:flavin oxidoreductase [Alphaproteobacteria bacterium]|jgi:2,4-dienoyl-CoA reductase-like NADH-dependent reductase (Old Yellow Enzyme family)|nr:NADH:flavin oxidoreductase [Alphaproteobacteria bacterium]
MAAAKTDPLLEPFRLKGLTLRNRVMSTSHACGLEEGGLPTAAYQAYHEEKAKGGIALSMFGGSSNVAPDSPNVFRQLNVASDAIIPHFQTFSERMHAQGAALMCQITHLGRRGESYAGDWLPTIGPSAVRETLHRSFPKAMDEDDIARVVKAFGDAAWRCREGGLDGIETLAGGHLIGQFLSPTTNRRSDRFGGSLENRCRFGLMVYEEIRRRVGDEFVVGFRYVVDEGSEDGLGFDDCVEIARVFEGSGLIDFFNAVYGRMDTALALAVDNMPGMASGMAPWLTPVAAFRREVGLPVFHAARIADIATARHAISEGLLDMVAMTRAHIADPHIVTKLARGDEDRVRPCVGVTHCMSVHRPTCIHNAATGRELREPHDIPPAARPRRKIVIVGGGPAGLEAARVAGERGHEVALHEATSRLGGQIQLAARASWRRDLVGIVDWRAAELDRLGVAVHLNSYLEPADIEALAPEVVIVATGGLADLDWLPGREHATDIWQALTGEVPAGGEVVVYDGTGRHAAATAAERYAMAGRTVAFAAIDDQLTPEMNYAERVIWKRRFYELGLETALDQRLVEVATSGNRLRAVFRNEVTGFETERLADEVVVAHGTVPVDELYQALAPMAANGGVTDIDALLTGRPQPEDKNPDGAFALYRIGDAVASRNIAAAVYDALRLCRTL